MVDEGRQRVLDPVGERVHDRVLDRREAVLEEEGAEHRFEQRREDVAVLCQARDVLALVEGGETPAEVELVRDDGAARAGDDVRTHLREPAFRELGMARVERVRHRELEDAVAEEFETLVRGGALGRPRRVCECRRCRCGRQQVDQVRELPAALGATGGMRRSRRPARRS